MNPIVNTVLFWVLLFGVFVITFRVLVEIDLAQYYKNKKPFVVYTSYALMSLVASAAVIIIYQGIVSLSFR